MKLFAPLLGIKSMVNFGVKNGAALTDACFPVFSAMPKLRYPLLTENADRRKRLARPCKAVSWIYWPLTTFRLEDAGLLRAASIPKLSHIWIDHTAVTL